MCELFLFGCTSCFLLWLWVSRVVSLRWSKVFVFSSSFKVPFRFRPQGFGELTQSKEAKSLMGLFNGQVRFLYFWNELTVELVCPIVLDPIEVVFFCTWFSSDLTEKWGKKRKGRIVFVMGGLIFYCLLFQIESLKLLY